MASISNIKQAAQNLRYNVPTGDDPAVLQDIASQVGFYDYHYPEDNDALYSILSDEMTRKGMDKFWGEDMDGNQYDDDVFYDSENDEYVYRDEDGNELSRQEREEEKAKEQSDDGSEEQVEENSSSNTSSDSSDDSSNSDSPGSNKDETDLQNNIAEENKGENAEKGDTTNRSGEQQNQGQNIKADEETSGLDDPANKQNNHNQNNNGNNPNQNLNESSQSSQFDLSKKENLNSSSNKTNTGSSNLSNSVSNGSTGNGYNSNAVNKKKAENKSSNVTNRASNVHDKETKAREARKAERSGSNLVNKGKSAGKETAKKAGEGAKNLGKKAGATAKKGVEKGAKAIGKAIAETVAALAKSPYFWIGVVIVLVLLLILLVVLTSVGGGSSNGNASLGNGTCKYSVSGVTSSGTVDLENLQVELVNCDANESNYTVLATIPFEKYVVGVAAAEIGVGVPDEAFKAQIVAVRSYTLVRNSQKCPGNPDGCFYGYNTSTGKIRMRVCENDQVYWDYTADIYRKDEGDVSKYTPEIDSSSGTLWKSKLDDETIKHIEELGSAVMGEYLVDSSGNVDVKTEFKSKESNDFISYANQGKTYEEILEAVYGDSLNGATCSSYGDIDYGDYSLSSDGDNIISQDLASFLQSKGTSIEAFNQKISDNVNKAGYGTRAGVVAAAVTLISELGDNYDVKVPYFWGGGHSGTISVGASGNWGSTSCSTYANKKHYNRCGLDCSGFVGWAIYNGGYSNVVTTADSYYKTGGASKVTLSKSSAVLQPGDLMASSEHVVMVVGIDEANSQYIIAHASGLDSGVLFSRWSYSYAASEYYGIDMSGFYDNPNKVRN